MKYNYLIRLKMTDKLDSLINSSELIKISKTLSYLSFTVKEMIQYYVKTTSREIPYFILRNSIKKMNSIKNKIDKLRVI